MKRTSHSYFVAMVDFGKRGLEAVVRPEWTERDIIAMLKSGELKDVAFIHHVDGLYIEDVTDELKGEASFAQAIDAIEDVLGNRQAANFDHARDHRKHEVA